MNIVEEKWSEIIEALRIEHEISNISYKTWITPLKVVDIVDNTVSILVDKSISLDYIQRKYSLPLKVCISEVTGIEFDIQFVSETNPSVTEKNSSLNLTEHYQSKNNIDSEFKNIIEKAHLQEKYNFNTFVVGKNNNFAHAASLAVAESPGKVYNPLFIYGGVGLGKTHLMNSIALFILENNPSCNVLYVTSELFTNDLIESIKKGNVGNEMAMSTFRNKYRNVDVLLIDDIQFIIGKESTQEEFFHTFNHLYMSGKQIIISSDKPPKEISTLESRLKTRFEWGLISDIGKPDYETRLAILHKKIELDHLERYHISNEILEYIAKNVTSNIRELEGCLNKIIAFTTLNKQNNRLTEIDFLSATEAIKDIITPTDNKKITSEFILEIVSEHFNISINDLKGSKRNREVSIPRQIFMYLCRKMTDEPLKSIGLLLGGKDHSTVSHGIEKIETDMQQNESLKNTVNILMNKINPT